MLDTYSIKITVYLENGTRYSVGNDPVNIKHRVARVSQHQLSFLLHLASQLMQVQENIPLQ